MRRSNIANLFKYDVLLAGCLMGACVVTSFSPSVVVADDDELILEDFAFSRTVEASEAASVYGIPLPEEVYRSTTRVDLGDVRVFNAEGAIVPHQIDRRVPKEKEKVAQESLKFFPIEGQASADVGQAAVQMEQDESGNVVRVTFEGGAKAPASEQSWYLIDARSLAQSMRALTLECEGLKVHQIVSVNLEGSDDLMYWYPVPAQGVIAKLAYGGQTFERNRLEFTPFKPQYLKVRFDQVAGITLKGVSAETAFYEDERVPLSWTEVSGTREEASQVPEASALVFDAGGHFPVRTLQISLPTVNTVLRVHVDSRESETAQWSRRLSETVYRLGASGAEVVSPAMELAATTRDRFWRIELQGKDASFGKNRPTLRLGWNPERLLFLSQGEGPFEVAYGSAVVVAPDFGLGDLSSAGQGYVALAQVGQVSERGGAQRLIVPPPARPVAWKKWILWVVLVGFVGLVALMAHRLWKDLQSAAKTSS